MEEVPAGPHEHRHQQRQEERFERPVNERPTDAAPPLRDEAVDALTQPVARTIDDRRRRSRRGGGIEPCPADERMFQTGPGGQTRQHAARLFNLAGGQPQFLDRRPASVAGCHGNRLACQQPADQPPPGTHPAPERSQRRDHVQERGERAAVPAGHDVIADQPLPGRAIRPQFLPDRTGQDRLEPRPFSRDSGRERRKRLGESVEAAQ